MRDGMSTEDISGYDYKNGELDGSHDYILPCILGLLDSLSNQQPATSSKYG